MGFVLGESLSSLGTKPCVFQVAPAGDEEYVVCAAVSAGVVLVLFCSRTVAVASSSFACFVRARSSESFCMRVKIKLLCVKVCCVKVFCV